MNKTFIPNRSLRIGIDVGGTFTDGAIWDDNAGKLVFSKVPSTPPTFADGVIAAGLEALSQMDASFGDIEHLVHSSTVAANVVAEKKGARVGLITTAGFRDVLEIQRTRRDRLYDLFYDKPVPLVPRELRLEVPERVDAQGNILVPLDEAAVRGAVESLRTAGCDAIAVVFLFSFINPKHELRVAEIIGELYPQAFVSVSAKVNPEFREYERASTTVIDAYVKPQVTTYYQDLERRLRTEHGFRGRLDIIHSGGGTMGIRDAAARPSQTVESGPACGVIAAAHLAQANKLPRVIALDMGGTTAKAAYIENGQFKTNNTLFIERLPVRAPVVDLIEISGGGGTLAWMDDGGLLHVGPRSAGARPGPICYARGGTQPTITDANAVVGYYPEQLIGGKMQLDIAGARAAFKEQLSDRLGMTETEAALGVLRIANFDMEAAIRLVTTQRGIDARTCVLIAFGGAGPVHAATLARVRRDLLQVVIPAGAGQCELLFGVLDRGFAVRLPAAVQRLAGGARMGRAAARARRARCRGTGGRRSGRRGAHLHALARAFRRRALYRPGLRADGFARGPDRCGRRGLAAQGQEPVRPAAPAAIQVPRSRRRDRNPVVAVDRAAQDRSGRIACRQGPRRRHGAGGENPHGDVPGWEGSAAGFGL